VRRASTPLGIDLIDAYANAEISRRDFLRRGTVLGVSATVLTSVLAACATELEVGQRAQTPGRILPTTSAIEPTAPPAPTSPPDPTAEAVPSPTPEPTPAPANGAAALRVGTIFGDVNTGLDPLNMLDLGTYGVVSQSFEYLVGLAPDGFIGSNGLARSWAPNADGTAWTFDLRPGVMWHDGTLFTAVDVVASIDRLAAARSGLNGTVSPGATEAFDDLTVVVNLDRPMSNLPVLLSALNPQALITPVNYSEGTTLDQRPNGTGPWRLTDYDQSRSIAVFEANPAYWGGSPLLDQVSFIGFENDSARVSAFAAGEIDVVQSFEPTYGSSLLDDRAVTILSPASARHRQVWFNTQLPVDGALTDPIVRKAIACCIDRQQVVNEVYAGRAIIANDHPIHPSLPFFDAGAVDQRVRNIDQARELLSQAGIQELDVTLQVGDLAISQDMASVLSANCADAGIRLEISVTRNIDFYGDYWCSGASYGSQPDSSGPGLPCGASAAMGIVDYGHRPIPDVYLGRSLVTDGDWNSSNFASTELDAAFAEYQAAMDVAAQRRAASDIQRTIHDETPVIIPAFAEYLAAHRGALQNVQASALGHLRLERARWAS